RILVVVGLQWEGLPATKGREPSIRLAFVEHLYKVCRESLSRLWLRFLRLEEVAGPVAPFLTRRLTRFFHLTRRPVLTMLTLRLAGSIQPGVITLVVPMSPCSMVWFVLSAKISIPGIWGLPIAKRLPVL